MTHTYGTHEVSVEMVEAPDGSPGLLLQLPNGYLVMKDPKQVRRLAAALLDGSDELEKARGKKPWDGGPTGFAPKPDWWDEQ